MGIGSRLALRYRDPMQLALVDPPTDERPARIGHAQVTYSPANALLQPASGFIKGFKFTLNPYSGCSFACDYCYARFFARTAELQDDWGNWVRVKENALALLERSIRSKSERVALKPGDSIYMSSVTDPYQPVESKLRLSRAILERLVDLQPRLVIQTRSPLVAADIDILQRLEHVRVNISIPTDSENVRLRYEPHAPAIAARLKTAEKLRAAGIAIGLTVTPTLPIRDPAAFGKRLAALDAAEYVTQYLHSGRTRFAAGTPAATSAKLAEDAWDEPAYRAARAIIAAELGPGRTLWEGNDGFQPPP